MSNAPDFPYGVTCPKCKSKPGSYCRSGLGKVARNPHTARFDAWREAQRVIEFATTLPGRAVKA